MPRTYKRLQRLFVTDPLKEGARITLENSQINYLANVLRRKVGDQIILFNGQNGAWLANIAELSRKSIVLECCECIAEQTKPYDLWYGFAPLKTARLDYMVQKATEMGVSAMQPVMTQHTQNSRFKHERIVANVIEAAEQCEVLTVPEVAPLVSLVSLVDNWASSHKERVLFVADESAPSTSPLEQIGLLAGKPIGLLVGPEGGVSDSERELLLAQDFVTPISLGPRILRADTAAVAALALIQSRIGDWTNHR